MFVLEWNDCCCWAFGAVCCAVLPGHSDGIHLVRLVCSKLRLRLFADTEINLFLNGEDRCWIECYFPRLPVFWAAMGVRSFSVPTRQWQRFTSNRSECPILTIPLGLASSHRLVAEFISPNRSQINRMRIIYSRFVHKETIKYRCSDLS